MPDLERWPGYTEQSWPERFAELDRRYAALEEAVIKAAQADVDRRIGSIRTSIKRGARRTDNRFKLSPVLHPPESAE